MSIVCRMSTGVCSLDRSYISKLSLYSYKGSPCALHPSVGVFFMPACQYQSNQEYTEQLMNSGQPRKKLISLRRDERWLGYTNQKTNRFHYKCIQSSFA